MHPYKFTRAVRRLQNFLQIYQFSHNSEKSHHRAEKPLEFLASNPIDLKSAPLTSIEIRQRPQSTQGLF